MTLIDDELRRELSLAYAAPDRHYHGLAHIRAMLDLAAEHRAMLADPEAVEAAIWFHDAVYDSRRADNEAASADLARERLAGWAESARIERIAAMILATATHDLPDALDGPTQADAACLLDMDLSILGAEPATFDAYEAAVRREYGWVDEARWRAGRAAVLKTFLARGTIFLTAPFRDRFEARARANLTRSLAALES